MSGPGKGRYTNYVPVGGESAAAYARRYALFNAKAAGDKGAFFGVSSGWKKYVEDSVAYLEEGVGDSQLFPTPVKMDFSNAPSLADTSVSNSGDPGNQYVPDVSPGQVFEAWQTGMDCMLIPMRILRKMYEEEPELPFCCIAHGVEGLPFIGEDNFFVHRLRKHGFKLLVNTDVQCLHMDVTTGKYTAHPEVDLNNYFTNVPITEPLTMADKRRIDEIWATSTPKIEDYKHE